MDSWVVRYEVVNKTFKSPDGNREKSEGGMELFTWKS
jgi:hypothetical protein